MNTQQGLRMVYNNAIRSLSDAGYSPAQIHEAVLSQSYLRFEQLLTDTTQLIKFPVLVNQTSSGAAIRNTEVRLNLQDAFIVSDIQFYLAAAGSLTAVNFVLDTYPNSVTYPTGAANLEVIYNAYLNIGVNNRTIVPRMSMQKFRQVPQTQLTADVISPIDQYDGTQSVIVEPNIVFNGQKQTDVSVVLPGAIGTVDANTYLVMICNGLLAQNVTVVS